MFNSPDPGSERALRSARNPRRRQRSDRDSIGDSIRPRRKRSKLSAETFAPRPSSEVDEGLVTNGDIHTVARRRKGSLTMSVNTELPVRGTKPGSIKRAMKGDGATMLMQNKIYSVKLLPSTPKELRKEGVEYRGSLGAEHLALAVTRTHAFVWDYTAHTQVNNERVFDAPFPAKDSDPLPFGALVTSGVSTDVGLVLVSAASGKIVFFESTERAAALGLFQERNTGVEGSLGSMFSGETVTALTPADHAGLILTLSSGRIAQVTLRDAQGKARVFAQFLRPNEPSSGGLLGSIRGLIGPGPWKRDVAAVHTRSLGTRGQMQVMSLTEKGEMQFWDVDWSGRYDFKATIDFRTLLVQELKSLESAETQGRVDGLAALDFVVIDRPATARGDEVATIGAEQPLEMWILVRTGALGDYSYALAQLSLVKDDSNIRRILPLDSYCGQTGKSANARPKVLLPRPGHTALVAFDDAMILVSTTESEPDPDAQLHAVSFIETGTFEDAVYLRSGKSLAIIDSVQEESKGGHSSAVAFVKSAGLVRFSVVDPAGDVERTRMPAKSRLEQAVFYGALQDNILDFSRKGDNPYSIEDIEEAALAISDETLRSASSFLSTSPTSIEAQLTYKAQALHALASSVRQNYPALSRSVMWQLLWNAERVAAAQQMWSSFEEYSAAGTGGRRRASIFDELCIVAQQGLKLDLADDGDDVVGGFFVKALSHVDWLLAKVRQIVEAMKEPSNDAPAPERILRIVMEADDVWVKTLETVFAFRADNAAAYGITSEFMSEGVLIDAAQYVDLPEFWTSSWPMLKSVIAITQGSREIAKEHFEHDADPPPEIAGYVKQIIDANPRLVQIICLLYQERIHWLRSRPDAKEHDQAHKLEGHFNAQRYDELRALQGAGQTDAALKMAEKYKDMHTLTDLIVAETQYALDVANGTQDPGEKNAALEHLGGTLKRIGKYFEKFGDAWANAFFDEAFSGSRAGRQLDEAQSHWKQALTKYLRADPTRAKICWINDVTAEKDFGHAADMLTTAGTQQETKLWAKKVELSMSKLALMAAQEELADATSPELNADLQKPERELEVVEVQERLYQHVLPEVIHCIDREAELQVAMHKYAKRNPDLSSLKQLLSIGLDKLLDHDALPMEELIDVLTLMDIVVPPEGEDDESNLQGQEFFLALRVLNAAAPGMPQDRFEMLLQLIWKRCYAYDDWVSINKMSASKKHTAEDLARALRNTAVWRTLYTLHSTTLLSQPECNVRVLTPNECLGAGCMPNHLVHRFQDAELLDPILHDNKIQDELLQSYVTDRRLEEWASNCDDDARKRVDEEAEETAEGLTQEREFESEGVGNGVNGDRVNGHVNGFAAEAGGEDFDMA